MNIKFKMDQMNFMVMYEVHPNGKKVARGIHMEFSDKAKTTAIDMELNPAQAFEVINRLTMCLNEGGAVNYPDGVK